MSGMLLLLMPCAESAEPAHAQGVQGISDIITIPGLVNVDFADVKAIMCNSGTAMLGVGVATGKGRAEEAALVRILLPFSANSLVGVPAPAAS
jgi:cell division protein FtsZ